MKQFKILNDLIKNKILEFLYQDEMYNLFLIHFIENQIDDLGKLYSSEYDEQLDGILHIKFDGNSNFTTFYYNNQRGLLKISGQLKKLNHPKILLADKTRDIIHILPDINHKTISSPDIYYRFNIEFNSKLVIPNEITFRQANTSDYDLQKIRSFLIDFFEASNEKEVADLTHLRKIQEDLKVGIFFIEYNKEAIGMARYSGITKNYIDITTVYIEPTYRSLGYGRLLMYFMIQSILKVEKTPVTQTNYLNVAAKRTYESLGFEKQEDYSFEFIS